MDLIPFCKGIKFFQSLKVNVKERGEFELSHNDLEVLHVSYNTTGTSTVEFGNASYQYNPRNR